MENLCRRYPRLSDADKLRLINLLIEKYKLRNTSRIDPPERDLLRGTALLEALEIYESYRPLPTNDQREFVLRRMLRDAMSIEEFTRFRNEEHYRLIFSASRIEYENAHPSAVARVAPPQAQPSEPVSVEFNRTRPAQRGKKRSLTDAFEAENEKRVEFINDKRKKLNQTECAICFEPLITDICMIRPCGHSFHCKCINEARQHKNECPLCREPVTEVLRAPDKEDSTTTDGKSGGVEPGEEVNSFGKSILLDLRYLKNLRTKARKAGR